MSIPQALGATGLAAALFATLSWSLPGCVSPRRPPPYPPTPGLPRYQRSAAIQVPGGVVNAAGGNLLVRRVGLSIDTRLGTREIAATWNSATRAWLWSFEMAYDGETFVDARGARHATGALGNGEKVPGSVWIKLDSRRIQSAGGLVHEFDAEGKLSAVHWQSGEHPRLEYLTEPSAGGRRIAAIRQCRAPGSCAGVVSIAYDLAGRIVSIADRAGRVAGFSWDAAGNLVAARDGLDTARSWPGTRYAYRDGGLLFALTSSEEERVEVDLDPGTGRVLAVHQPAAGPSVHRFDYGKRWMASDPDRAEYETRYTDPLGHTTLLRHDGEGRLLSTEDPHGEVTERGWNGFEVSRLTLPDGATTTWGHFDWDEIVRRDPTGNVVHVNFRIHGGENRQDPYRRPVDRIEDSLGLVEQRHYLEGRLAWAENGATERTRFEYDAENMLASLTTPDGTTVSFSEYGEHGHAGRVAVAGEVETRVFDAVGNRVSRSGFERFDFRPGGELERGWDEARNLARISLADAALDGPSTPQEIRLSHRSDGRPTRIERPGGGDHEFVYDAAGRLAERRERVDGSWSVTHFEVDALGRTTAVTLPNGMRRETEYDASGRVRALRALRGGALETEAVLEWNAGRLRSILDARSGELEALEFDEAGLPVAIDFPGGERLEWSHDPRGRTTEEIYRLPGGAQLRRLGFDHDPADRETGVRDDGEVLVQRVYAGGRLVETHTGNGLRRRHLYDPASGLLQGSTLEHPTHGIVAATGISLEALEGGVWLRAETTSSEPASGTTVEEYLLGPSGNGPGVAGKRVLAWSDGIDFREHAYDALGNLVSGNGLRRVYNAERNRLQRIEEEASGQEVAHFEYDEAGHATARNGDAIRWTAQGFVAAVGDDAHFEWDALGRPRRRTLGGQETRLLFGGRVEADASGAPLRLDRGDVVLHLDTGERLYRHRDFRGNTKLVSDDTGRVVAHRGYAAYGLATLTGSADESSGFAGGRPVGDLLLLGHRLHDPLAGRFLAPDPVFQIVSQHVYAHGNPVWFWDPGGLDAEPTEMPAGMQRAMLMMSVGLGYGAAGLWVGVHFSPPFGYLLGGAGVALFNRGFFELLKAIEEDQEGGPAVPGGRGGSAAPGTSGVPGGGGLQVPGLGGPEHPLSAPPNPGCPCGDGVPGGGQVGSGAQIQTGAGFGGLGGFGGF